MSSIDLSSCPVTGGLGCGGRPIDCQGALGPEGGRLLRPGAAALHCAVPGGGAGGGGVDNGIE